MKITPTSLKIDQLFGSENEQYVIPAYQRRYSWRKQQVFDLLDDIDYLEKNDTHLLGSLVCLTDSHTADLNFIEVVDGQQRLTTLAILFACLNERFEESVNDDVTSGLKRFLVARTSDGDSVPKIALDSLDADEFSALCSKSELKECKNGQLKEAFSVIREWIDDSTDEELAKFIFKLKNHVVGIRLDVTQAKDAFKLFETINNRGLALSPTDIIKNFLLGNAARFGEEHLSNARRSWAQILRHLDGTNSDNFFRHLLTARTHTRITTAYIVTTFKTLFMKEVEEAKDLPEREFYVDEVPDDEEDEKEADADENDAVTVPTQKLTKFDVFVSDLVSAAKIYGEIVFARTRKPQVDRHLRNLRMIKMAQAYAFLMHLRIGGIKDRNFVEILRLTEAFLLRRHICRERANETERLFAKLCEADPENPTNETVVAYRKECPSDERFRQSFCDFHFNANIIDRARYCLEKIELSGHGNEDELGVLGADAVHIEHIIPQTINTKKAKREFGDWVEYLGENASRHGEYVSRIGNLTLFSGRLNIGASNGPFNKKKEAYKQSAIKITRDLVNLRNFRLPQVENRSEKFADLAVQLWPIPEA